MKKKKSISDNALKVINTNHLKPIPKWEFMVKNGGLWLGIIICITLFILDMSVSWFGLIDNIITPYFWLFIALIFLILAFILFEKTKKAYRLQKWHVITTITAIGLLVGGILFKAGVGSKIDRNLESNIPYYRQMVPMKMMIWNNPDQGYLSGEITVIIDTDHFEIKDFNGKNWLITSTNSILRGQVQVIIGETVKLIGNQTGENSFETNEIRPWNGMMRQNMMKENGR